MTTNAMAHPRRTSVALSTVFRAARWFTFGFLGWLWLSSADEPARTAVSLVAVLALAATVSITGYLSHVHTERRWRAAWDRYAEQELAKLTDSRRDPHARPRSPIR